MLLVQLLWLTQGRMPWRAGAEAVPAASPFATQPQQDPRPAAKVGDAAGHVGDRGDPAAAGRQKHSLCQARSAALF